MEKNIHEFEIELKDEWLKCLDNAFEKANKKTKVDGFRQGHAPKDVFLKKYGIESLYQDAFDEACQVGYKKVTEKKEVGELIPVIEPETSIVKVDEKSITLKFTIITKPEVKLGEYKNLGIKAEKAKVTKEEVADEIKHLQEQYADLVVKKSGAIEKGDTAIIDFKGFVDGKVFDGGTAENYALEIGSGSFIPGFEDKLVGVKKGETVNLDLKFPENYTPELKGKPVVFEVKVNEIKERKLPEINKDFFEDLGYEGVTTKEELEKKVKADLTAHKQAHLDDDFIEKCLAKASENMKVTIDDRIVDAEVHRMMHQYEQRLAQQGMSLDLYYKFTNTTHEDLHKQMEPEALKTLKYRYLIDAVAEAEGIKTTKKEVEERAEEVAKMYGVTKEELIKEFGSLEVVEYDLRMHKALELIKKENEKTTK